MFQPARGRTREQDSGRIHQGDRVVTTERMARFSREKECRPGTKGVDSVRRQTGPKIKLPQG